MTPPEFLTRVARPSEAERERALGTLRDNLGSGRLSQDTFMGRIELVLTARSRAELDAALFDLPADRRVSRLLLRTVGQLSAFTARLRNTWRTEQLPGLILPAPGTRPVRIGRLQGSDLRLGDSSVSRTHAELRHDTDGWILHDLGSSNGTHVNGLRVIGAVRVHPGDQVTFGILNFRLAAG
ncbi:DUF1707 and FHA domain-containing protein [Kitasatospora sp. MAP5-34]|uniref:DUF1707 and FHA domain-containing protein n=1 Tax=Kitasatospora sp. MAP5-34 TaxID=3035102 RepID=UPI0024742738|nr:DUF1707 and FHA domain-containing protein [Kitasatospora sp. MAP5-34]MDH6576589.1 hypothetical protein [Kitasatospora sp. MAP5-34]